MFNLILDKFLKRRLKLVIEKSIFYFLKIYHDFHGTM